MLMCWRQARRWRAAGVDARPEPARSKLGLSPPILFVGVIALAALLEAVFPLSEPPASPLAWLIPGALVVVSAELLMRSASRALKRHRTSEDALRSATTLVRQGPFARSRHPIYAGMLLLFIGLVVAAKSLWALLLLAPLFAVLHLAIVRREEAGMLEQFGDAYRAYTERVPRYL